MTHVWRRIPFFVAPALLFLASFASHAATPSHMCEPRPGCKLQAHLQECSRYVNWHGQCSGGLAEGKGVIDITTSDGRPARIVAFLKNGVFSGVSVSASERLVSAPSVLYHNADGEIVESHVCSRQPPPDKSICDAGIREFSSGIRRYGATGWNNRPDVLGLGAIDASTGTGSDRSPSTSNGPSGFAGSGGGGAMPGRTTAAQDVQNQNTNAGPPAASRPVVRVPNVPVDIAVLEPGRYTGRAESCLEFGSKIYYDNINKRPTDIYVIFAKNNCGDAHVVFLPLGCQDNSDGRGQGWEIVGAASAFAVKAPDQVKDVMHVSTKGVGRATHVQIRYMAFKVPVGAAPTPQYVPTSGQLVRAADKLREIRDKGSDRRTGAVNPQCQGLKLDEIWKSVER
jgi:hypothetical protein